VPRRPGLASCTALTQTVLDRDVHSRRCGVKIGFDRAEFSRSCSRDTEAAEAITGSQLILVLKGIAVSYRTERMMLIPYGPPTFIVPAGFLLGARPLPFPGRTAPVAEPLVKNMDRWTRLSSRSSMPAFAHKTGKLLRTDLKGRSAPAYDMSGTLSAKKKLGALLYRKGPN
jgi:hypothetical protein